MLKVLDLLATEAGFLVDKKLKESIKSLPEAEQKLHEVDAILKTLGVEDREDLDEIVALFYANAETEDDGTKAEAAAAEEEEAAMVHPNDFIKVVRKFVAAKQAKSAGNGDSDGYGDGDGDGDGGWDGVW